MLRLDHLLADAVERGDLPFAVAMVSDRRDVLWQGAAGWASPSHEAGPGTVMRLFSMTKAVGGLAALILVDRGQLSMDTTVVSVLPEFADVKVLDTMGPAGPVLRPPRRPVTLRHLLTHTSGLAYPTWDLKHAVWQLVTGAPHPASEKLDSMRVPLMFDPGEGVTYGIGFDWVGRIVEQIDGRSPDRFCREEVLDPLGMHNTVFEPDLARSRLADVKLRGADGALTAFAFAPPATPEVYGLGQALYGTAPDYMRLLRMVLNGGELDGVRILSAETLRYMTSNQIGDLSVPVMRTTMPLVAADIDFFPGARKTWTAGFMRLEQDVPEMRRGGSLSWVGFCNTHYWIDPASGIAAVLMTQSLPCCDERVMQTYTAFERATYRELPNLGVAQSSERAQV